MDVTPTPQMFNAMVALTDATMGAEPLQIETSPAAERRRMARRKMMDILHSMVAMSMRVGAARALQEKGYPTAAAPMKPEEQNG